MVSHPFPSLDNRLLLPHRKDSRHLLWSSLQHCPFICPGPCSEEGATGDGDPLSPSLSRDFTRAAPASCRGSGSCKGSPVSWAHFRAGTAAGHSRHPVGGKPFLTASVTLRDSRSKQLWNYRLWNKISTELIPIDAQNFWCSSRVLTICHKTRGTQTHWEKLNQTKHFVFKHYECWSPSPRQKVKINKKKHPFPKVTNHYCTLPEGILKWSYCSSE